MVLQVLWIKLMASIQTQLSRHTNKTQVIVHPERAHIKEIVMVRTQTDQIVHRVRSVVGPTEVIHDFDLTTQNRIANDTTDRALDAPRSGIARRYCELRSAFGNDGRFGLLN